MKDNNFKPPIPIPEEIDENPEEEETPGLPDDLEPIEDIPGDIGALTASWSNVRGGFSLRASLTFSGGRVFGVDSTDFAVFDTSGTDLGNDWTIRVAQSSRAEGRPIGIEATPPSNTTGSFAIQIYSYTVSETSRGRSDGPTSDVRSSYVSIDSRISTAAWSDLSYTSGKLQGTLTFSLQNISGLNSSEITVLNSSGTTQSGWSITVSTRSANVGIGITVQATPPANTSGSFKLRLESSSVYSGNSNSPNAPASDVDSSTVTLNSTTTTAAWSSVSFTSGKLQGTLTFTGANVTDIDSEDFEVLNSSNTIQTNWTFDTPSTTATAGTGITIAATPPATTNASFKLRLKDNSVKSGGSETANTPASAVTSGSISVNTIPAATVSWSNITGGTTLSGRITFSGASVTNIGSSDFEVLKSSTVQTGWSISVSSSTASSGGYVTVTATPPSNQNSSFKLRIKATSVRSGGSSTNNAPTSSETSSSIAVDNRPQLTVTAFTPGYYPYLGSTYTSVIGLGIITFSHSIPISQLSASDFYTSRSDVSVSLIRRSRGNDYSIYTTQPKGRSGSYTITIRANAVASSTIYKGGPTSSYTSSSIRFNVPYRRATASWSSVSFTSGKLQGTITFSGASIVGLETSDFEVLSGSTVQTGWTISLPSGITASSTRTSGTGTIIKAAPPTNTNGSYKLRLKATSVRSDGSSSNNSPASATSTSDISVDARPQLSVSSFTAPTSSTQTPITTTTANFTLTFDRAVPATELTTSDFTGTNGASVTSIATSPVSQTSSSIYTITVTQPAHNSGTYTISISASAISGSTTYKPGPVSSYQSTSVTYNTRVIATASWSSVSYCPATNKLSGTLTFSGANITGIAATDFEVLDSSNTIQTTGWSFDTPSTTANDGSGLTISVTPPANRNASYKLRLKALSVQSDGSSSNNAPVSHANLTTTAIAIDNRPQLIISSFTTPTGTQTGTTATLTLTFDRAVPASELTTGDFTGTNGASVTSIVTSPTSGQTNSAAYSLIVTQPTHNSGTYTISLSANTISGTTTYKPGPLSNDTNRTSPSVTYNTRVIATAAWSNISFCEDTQILSGTLTFTGASITGIESSDFQILDRNNFIQTNWGITVPSSTADDGVGIIISATPPEDASDHFKFNLRATSVRSDGATVNNAPVLARVSSEVEVDLLTPLDPSLPWTISKISGKSFGGIASTNPSFGINEYYPESLATDGTTTWFIGKETNALYTIDLTTTEAIRIGTSINWGVSETNARGLAYLNSKLYMVGFSTKKLYEVDTSTGIATVVGTTTDFGSVSETNPQDLASDGTNLYMVGGTKNCVYTLNTTTGIATRVGGTSANFASTENDPKGIAHDGTNLYMVGGQHNLLYTINTTTGVAIRNNTAIQFGNNITIPKGLLANGTSLYMLADNLSGSLWTLNKTSGIATNITKLYFLINTASWFGIGEYEPESLATDGTTTWFTGRTNNALYTLNLTTAQGARIGSSSNWGVNETGSRGLTYANSKLYMVGSSTNKLYEVNTGTGIATVVDATTTNFGVNETEPRDLASNGSTIYMLGGSTNAIYTLDTSNGTATIIGSSFATTENEPRGIAHDGTNLYMVGNQHNRLYTIDTSNGNVTVRGIATQFGSELTDPKGLLASGTDLYMLSDNLSGSLWTLDKTNGTATPNAVISSILRFTPTGTYESSGDITISTPPKPTAVGSGYFYRGSRGLAISNNKLYILTSWSSGTNSRSSIEIYNFDGTHNRNCLTSNISTVYTDLDVRDGQIFLSRSVDNTVYKYNSNDGTLIDSFLAITATRGIRGIGVSGLRIYVFVRDNSQGSQVRAFNRSYIGKPLETTSHRLELRDGTPTLTSLRFVQSITIIDNTLYTFTSNRGEVYEYTSVPQLITTWSTPTYISTSRAISSTLTFNESPNGFTASGFKVESRSGSAGSYIWSDSSNWTIIANAGTTSRIITATPDSSILPGTYRITLNSNAFGTHLPSTIISTAGVNVIAIVATASWSSVSYTSGGLLQGTITFSGASIVNLETSDFQIVSGSIIQTGWAISLPSTIISSSTITSGTEIIIKATPPDNTNASYKLRLKMESVQSGGSNTNNAPGSIVDSTSISIDNRPQLTISSFTAPVGEQTNATADFILTFDRNIPANELETSDFTVPSSASIFLIDPSSGSQSTYTITVTQPTHNSGTYTISLNANAISGGTTYRPGPLSSDTNRTSAAVTYNTRSIATASWSNVSYCPTTDKLSGTLTFIGASITGIEVDDFQILDNSNIDRKGGWVFDTLLSSTAMDGVGITIAATPPTNTNASYKLSLERQSVRSDGATSDNAPASDIISDAIVIDNRPDLTASFTAPTGTQTGTTINFNLEFNQSIPASELSTEDFIGTNGALISSISPTVSSQTTYTVIVTQPTHNFGTYSISLNANAVSGSSTYKPGPATSITSIVNYDTRINAIATWSNLLYDGNKFQGILTFTGAAGTVTGISSSDFQVLNTINVNQQWTFDTVPSEATIGTGISIKSNPPANTNGIFKLSLAANSVNSDGKTSNAPTTTSISNDFRVDTRLSPPRVSTEIPDQTVIRGTNATLNLNNHFSGNPLPTYNISSISRSWIILSNNILTISPSNSEIRSSLYSVTIRAINTQGTISDTFNITVRASSASYSYESMVILPESLDGIIKDTDDFTITPTYYYWLKNRPRSTDPMIPIDPMTSSNSIVQSDHTRGNIDLDFITFPNNLEPQSITNDGIYLYITIKNISDDTSHVYKYLISDGSPVTNWNIIIGTNPLDINIITYNTNNNQLYIFKQYSLPTGQSRLVQYVRYSDTGTLLGTHTLPANNRAAVNRITYDPESNYFYAIIGIQKPPLVAYRVEPNHQIVLDSNISFIYPEEYGTLGAIAYYDNKLIIREITTTPTTTTTKKLLTFIRFTPIFPIISATIPDQTIIAGTVITIDLNNHFIGDPALEYESL